MNIAQLVCSGNGKSKHNLLLHHHDGTISDAGGPDRSRSSSASTTISHHRRSSDSAQASISPATSSPHTQALQHRKYSLDHHHVQMQQQRPQPMAMQQQIHQRIHNLSESRNFLDAQSPQQHQQQRASSHPPLNLKDGQDAIAKSFPPVRDLQTRSSSVHASAAPAHGDNVYSHQPHQQLSQVPYGYPAGLILAHRKSISGLPTPLDTSVGRLHPPGGPGSYQWSNYYPSPSPDRALEQQSSISHSFHAAQLQHMQAHGYLPQPPQASDGAAFQRPPSNVRTHGGIRRVDALQPPRPKQEKLRSFPEPSNANAAENAALRAAATAAACQGRQDPYNKPQTTFLLPQHYQAQSQLSSSLSGQPPPPQQQQQQQQQQLRRAQPHAEDPNMHRRASEQHAYAPSRLLSHHHQHHRARSVDGPSLVKLHPHILQQLHPSDEAGMPIGNSPGLTHDHRHDEASYPPSPHRSDVHSFDSSASDVDSMHAEGHDEGHTSDDADPDSHFHRILALATIEFHHTGKITCPSCHKDFSRLCNFRSHFRIHQVTRPFICNICNQQFLRKHDLNRHERIHAGIKPFRCVRCGKGFVRKDALRRHENMVPDIQKFRCVAK
ncbi:hypothetical protein HKX48_008963 [Thoreauomyces humboldtii]|nr:hypothetical protein HKX48_008963 [Thoreauomyces humboldtii]